jgi:RNA polymerase sigma factor for flagellar operon FliA
MVHYLASKKVRELPAHCELDDLVSCGLIALVESIDRFNPARGATFEQYAWTRVSGAIMDELRRQDWAPRSLRRLGRRMERAKEELYAHNGSAPTDDELAVVLEMPVDELRAGREALDRAELVSLNAPARGSDDVLPVEVGDTVEATTTMYDPEKALFAGERVARIREAVGSLSEREREVLSMVLVLELSGAEIGRIFGVTESRVSQILGNTRRKLQAYLEAYDATAPEAA